MNKKVFDLYITEVKNDYFAIVPGYKNDIDLEDASIKFQDLKRLIDGINKTQMKQNDPDGDKWQFYKNSFTFLEFFIYYTYN